MPPQRDIFSDMIQDKTSSDWFQATSTSSATSRIPDCKPIDFIDTGDPWRHFNDAADTMIIIKHAAAEAALPPRDPNVFFTDFIALVVLDQYPAPATSTPHHVALATHAGAFIYPKLREMAAWWSLQPPGP